jgi:hypothetical protein
MEIYIWGKEMMIEREPMAWPVIQPDSYRVFVSYNEALIHKESCAGGDIVPLWANPKDKPVILKPTKEQKENFMKAFEENK